METRTEDIQVLKAISLGISEMLANFSQVLAQQSVITGIQVQGEDVQSKEAQAVEHLEQVKNDLLQVQTSLQDICQEKVRSRKVRQAVKMEVNLPSMVENISKAQKNLGIASMTYSEMPETIQHANVLANKAEITSSHPDMDDKEAQMYQMAYEQAIAEMEQIESFYNQIYETISSICEDTRRRADLLTERLEDTKESIWLTQNQRDSLVKAKDAMRSAQAHAVELAGMIKNTQQGAIENIAEWRRLLSLY